VRGGHIDWAALKRALAEAERKLASALVFDDTRRLALLRKRADHLAARRSAAAAASVESVLTFLLGDGCYAIALTALCQVVTLDKLMPVAGAPPKILGVMSLRGDIGTVWSLAGVLDLPPEEASGRGHVLVLKASPELGLRVDYVEGTRDIDVKALVPGGPVGGPLALRFCQGLTQDGIYVLDAEALRLTILSGLTGLSAQERPAVGHQS
jgi:chemotaxis signal transduction protein